MKLEKIAKNFLIVPVLIGAFYLGGCKNTITGNITVKKENVGEITGESIV